MASVPWNIAISLLICVSASLRLSLSFPYQGDEIGSGDPEFEPAAAVYEIMNGRLISLESRLEELRVEKEQQCGCKNIYTNDEIDQITKASTNDILNTVDKKFERMKENLLQTTAVMVSERLDQMRESYDPQTECSKQSESDLKAERSTDNMVLTTTPALSLLNGCEEVAHKGYPSGVYTLKINNIQMVGYCEINSRDGQAWLVIQRRHQGDISFYRSYKEYREGFGNLMRDFWLGLEKIYQITSKGNYTMRVDLTDMIGNQAYTEYSGFSLTSDLSGYRLVYSRVIGGTAGDSLIASRGQMFSTFDNDQDGSILYNCARLHKGAFWYNRCGNANLNGLLLADKNTYTWQNIHWTSWFKDTRPLAQATIKIRLVNSL